MPRAVPQHYYTAQHHLQPSSILLPFAGGVVAFGLARWFRLDERTKRTLVIEVVSKSPTLAYMLALRHFGVGAATVPAAAMVGLAVLGAGIAAVWGCTEI